MISVPTKLIAQSFPTNLVILGVPTRLVGTTYNSVLKEIRLSRGKI